MKECSGTGEFENEQLMLLAADMKKENVVQFSISSKHADLHLPAHIQIHNLLAYTNNSAVMRKH